MNFVLWPAVKRSSNFPGGVSVNVVRRKMRLYLYRAADHLSRVETLCCGVWSWSWNQEMDIGLSEKYPPRPEPYSTPKRLADGNGPLVNESADLGRGEDAGSKSLLSCRTAPRRRPGKIVDPPTTTTRRRRCTPVAGSEYTAHSKADSLQQETQWYVAYVRDVAMACNFAATHKPNPSFRRQAFDSGRHLRIDSDTPSFGISYDVGQGDMSEMVCTAE